MAEQAAAQNDRHHHVLVIGGGNGGLSVAGRLRRLGVATSRSSSREPTTCTSRSSRTSPAAERPPAWRCAARRASRPRACSGSRMPSPRSTPKPTSSRSPAVHESAYDQLIVCPGIQNDWTAIPGLAEAMRSPDGISQLRVRPRAQGLDAAPGLHLGHRHLHAASRSRLLRGRRSEADVPRLRLLAVDRACWATSTSCCSFPMRPMFGIPRSIANSSARSPSTASRCGRRPS